MHKGRREITAAQGAVQRVSIHVAPKPRSYTLNHHKEYTGQGACSESCLLDGYNGITHICYEHPLQFYMHCGPAHVYICAWLWGHMKRLCDPRLSHVIFEQREHQDHTPLVKKKQTWVLWSKL